MKTLFYILPLLLAGAACQSGTGYRSYAERPTIADKALMSVPNSDRGDIDEARTAHSATVDRVAQAEAEVERAEQRLSITKREVGIAASEFEAADARLELARSGNESDRTKRIATAAANRDAARARMDRARTQVFVEESRVAKLEAQVLLAQRRQAVAEAKVELAKAEAVSGLGRSDYESIDVRDFERCVADEELALKLAEIDAQASEEKYELRRKDLDARAKSASSSKRDA